MAELQEQAKAVAALLGQLANENRLLILCALLEGPKTVGQLGEDVPHITGPAMSQHLQKLRTAGLVDSTKHGQFVEYQIADQRLYGLMERLKALYCA